MSDAVSKFDLILSGGQVIDPSQGLNEVCEVGIRGRRIISIGQDLPRTKKTRVVDCHGLMVMPGLIDLHVHVAPGLTALTVDPDQVMWSGATTTMLDAGSAGMGTWEGLQKFLFHNTRAHVLALVNLCHTGLGASRIGELLSTHLSDPEGAIEVIQREPTRAVGVKIRAGTHLIGEGELGWKHLRQAVYAARESETFLMVHIGSTPMSLGELAAELSPGDMITHCYKGGKFGHLMVDDQGKVHPELLEAQERGIIFDLGHGQGSFDWDVAQRAVDQGLPPTTVSTDLHKGNINGPVVDMPLTMTKVITLGLSLEEVVARSTWIPAKALGLEDEIGTLKPGSTADVALLRWEEGAFDLADSYGKVRKTDKALRTAGVIRQGEIFRAPGE